MQAYQRTYGLPVTISRCSNNYGPYHFPEKLIPLMIINCLHDKPLPVYGEGLNVRDWLYVEDHCKAIDLVVRNGRIGEIYNIGGHNEIGKTVVAEPPAFPPAFPCSIKVGMETFFDFVLLRTQEIEDDGTYVIGNKEQEGHFYFEVRINPKKPRKPDFKINMVGGSNREHLNYLRFMKTLSTDKDIHIYMLLTNEDLIAGYINNMDLKTGFPRIEEEIYFLERVCAIEEYFGVTLKPDGAISQGEYDTVVRVSDLIRNDEVRGTWTEVTFTGVLDQHFREELTTMDEELYGFSYVGVSHVDLFGAEFEFRFMRTYNCARIVEYEKLKKKIEVLDDGDDVKITFRAGDDKRTVDTLKIPEHIDRAS